MGAILICGERYHVFLSSQTVNVVHICSLEFMNGNSIRGFDRPSIRRSIRPLVHPSVRRSDRVEKWNNERFGYFLCMFVYGVGLGCGWGLNAPANPSATIF